MVTFPRDMLPRNLILLLLVCLVAVGCQTTSSTQPEPARPLLINEPIYLLPSDVDFSALEMAQVLASQAAEPKETAVPVPVASAAAIEPDGTTAPQLRASSKPVLVEISNELPMNLPFQAVFLISSHGDVAEAVFVGSYNHPDERAFAARLRTLRFKPATHDGKSIAVIVAMDLRALGK